MPPSDFRDPCSKSTWASNSIGFFEQLFGLLFEQTMIALIWFSSVKFFVYVLSQLGMMHAKANPPEHSRMNTIKLGMLLPHEVASSLYHFRSGELFYSLLAGTPEEIGSKSSIINVFGQLEVLNQFKIKLCMLLYAFTILYAVCMCMGLPWPGQCFVLGKQPRLS